MTQLLEQALERLRELPETEQDLAAVELMSFVGHIDMPTIQLSDDQLVEVDRRLAKKNPKKGQLAIEAEDYFRSANDIAREQGALFWELRIAVSLARLRMIQGRQDEVRQLLAPVYDRFTEGFDTRLLRAARTLLGEQSA